MGLFDKMKDTLAGLTPDYPAALQEGLGSELLLAHLAVLPSATETDRSDRAKNLTEVAQGAAHHFLDKAVKDRHIGGDEGSIARSLPRSSDPMMLALAQDSATLWKFTIGKAPSLVARVERAEIASVTDTGKRTARGHVRLAFRDGSFFDYQTLKSPEPEFWAAAEGFSAA